MKLQQYLTGEGRFKPVTHHGLVFQKEMSGAVLGGRRPSALNERGATA
ncbi:hypothetical protein [Paenibacillus sp. DMB20]|nr:hypothetical protein [Paenibacillus sp. DMB20]